MITQYEVGTGGSVYNTVAEYIYDGDGNRLQQIDSSGATPITTTYTNDNAGMSQVLVSDDGTTTTANLFGLDLIQQDDGSETRTLLADGLGSARVEMVATGGTVAIETATTHEPYGKLLAQSGSSGTVYGYTGEQYDAATSLVYLRARYYSPYLNQFQSRDPFPGYAKLPQSQNGFSYVGNNPTNYIDPLGLRRCTPQEAALDFETCEDNFSSPGNPQTNGPNLFNFDIIPGTPGSNVIKYIMVEYHDMPWEEYIASAPRYPVMIPVRHPLNLREEYPDCGLGFEEVQAIYSNGNFYVWEVNARNIMASLNSVIANQKPYALRDAIGIAYAPYNRQQAGWTGYMGKDDPLSLLLAGGDNFEVSANSERYPGGYTAPFLGRGYSHVVYDFSLVVAYGVHNKYFYDTSYGASEYRHRPDEKSNDFIVCGVDGPAFFMHPGTRFNNYEYKWTTEELKRRGGWTLPVHQMPWPTADSWISPYPPVGCVSQ